MAADTIGLLDVLGLDSAHIVGASLGGMVAQTIAIEYPGRVRWLTSMMSTTGDRAVGQADLTALSAWAGPLVIIDGTGHSLPRPLWPEIATRIADLAARTEAIRAAT